MKPASIDTNILLRWLLEDIPEQAEIASRLIAANCTYLVSDMAIHEFAYVCEKAIQLPRSDVAAFIENILYQSNLDCNRALFSGVLPIYTSRPALSFVDCCLVVMAELNGATPLYTFDKKLANQLPTAEEPK